MVLLNHLASHSAQFLIVANASDQSGWTLIGILVAFGCLGFLSLVGIAGFLILRKNNQGSQGTFSTPRSPQSSSATSTDEKLPGTLIGVWTKTRLPIFNLHSPPPTDEPAFLESLIRRASGLHFLNQAADARLRAAEATRELSQIPDIVAHLDKESGDCLICVIDDPEGVFSWLDGPLDMKQRALLKNLMEQRAWPAKFYITSLELISELGIRFH